MLLFKRIFCFQDLTVYGAFGYSHSVYEAIYSDCLLTTARLVNKWITSRVSLIYTGLYASNGFDGMAEIVMAFVASMC
jgi:hypothetical protein